ncbi:methyl-accepting chemotaxis protein [Piscirickettsia salmonis]|uniref:methyl-accepting chemotaxis protein n=1 Tax=Piscirickettsia salmonis TaxID=1238 RepID=UPI003EB90B11
MQVIKSFFLNLSIVNKILLALFLPFLLIIYLCFNLISQKFSEYNFEQHIVELSSYTENMSNFLHRTQIERGMTAVYLSNSNQINKEKLIAARKATNKRIENYTISAKRLLKNPANHFIFPGVEAALKDINNLNTLRQKIDSGNISTKNAIKQFTELNSNLLNTLLLISQYVTENPKTFKVIRSAYDFSQAKERSGIIRAVVVPILAQNQTNTENYKKLVGLVTEFRLYIEQFRSVANTTTNTMLDKAIQSSEGQYFKTVINTILENNPNKINSLNTTPAQWFNQVTLLINQYRQIERYLNKVVVSDSHTAAEQKINDIIMQIYSICVILIFTLIVLNVFIRYIKSSLNFVISEAYDIEQGNLTIINEDHFSKDEIGQLRRQFSLMRQGLKSIDSAVNVLSAVSKGDLTQNIDGQYAGVFNELQNYVNQTVEHLTQIIEKIRSGSLNVSSAANEIAAGNKSLGQRTEEQAVALERTSANIEEISSMATQNSIQSKEASELSKHAQNFAENGGQVINSAINAMEVIKSSSKEISDIVGVINDISSQTNLLALNAAIEAARAGEQGRGFAVVANEIRQLAQRSATSATEINDLINEIVRKIEDDAELISEAGLSLDGIVQVVEDVSTKIAEINNASQEQATGVIKVNKSMGEIDKRTQANNKLAGQMTQSAENMERQAKRLIETISFFKTQK